MADEGRPYVHDNTQHPDRVLLEQFTTPWSGGEAPYDGKAVFEALDVDEDSVFSVALRRATYMINTLKERHGADWRQDDQVTMTLPWLDGFVTGMRFMRQAMEPHIIPDDGGHRGHP